RAVAGGEVVLQVLVTPLEQLHAHVRGGLQDDVLPAGPGRAPMDVAVVAAFLDLEDGRAALEAGALQEVRDLHAVELERKVVVAPRIRVRCEFAGHLNLRLAGLRIHTPHDSLRRWRAGWLVSRSGFRENAVHTGRICGTSGIVAGWI